MAVLRPYHPADLPGMYRVCLLTGDAGGDATALHGDPDLVGHVYLGPYVAADRTLAFVVADGEGVGGYLVGTADTEAFEAWCDEHWWPALRERYPRPCGAPGSAASREARGGLTPADLALVDHLHRPPRGAPPGYPAHLHVDLLPRLQGQGWGHRLIDSFVGALRERGVPGLHLEVDDRNVNARAFYRHLGFVPDEHPARLLLTVTP